LAELREATATAADLVAEEGMHTCFHGLIALAGQALSASEAGDSGAAKRALEVYDMTAVSGTGIQAYRTIEILRALLGADEARRRVELLRVGEAAGASVQGEVYRLRIELQLSALEREPKRLRAFAGRARTLALPACAPSLEWIADWADAVDLAEHGRTQEAVAKATTAAAALEAYGERYLAARLLVDLLPSLETGEATALAEDVIRRLEAMGARGSAAEAGRWLSRR
jgi:hypothetical protein